jgi:hypothetical protein
VIRRSVLFTSWALLGGAATYAALYLFTPFGMAILASCLLVAWLLSALSRDHSPEAWGLLAGPGLFGVLVSASADDPRVWIASSAALIGAALFAFARAMRTIS